MIALAIKKQESGGDYNAKGASGEYGAYQWKPATWRIISREMAGEILERTPVNENYIAMLKVQQLLDRGWNAEEIGRIWNSSLGGDEVPHKRVGVNKHGVRFNSISYGKAILGHYETLKAQEEI